MDQDNNMRNRLLQDLGSSTATCSKIFDELIKTIVL